MYRNMSPLRLVRHSALRLGLSFSPVSDIVFHTITSLYAYVRVVCTIVTCSALWYNVGGTLSKAHCCLFPTPLREGVSIFFFFFGPLWDLEAQLDEVSSHIPTRAEIRELIIAAANGDN